MTGRTRGWLLAGASFEGQSESSVSPTNAFSPPSFCIQHDLHFSELLKTTHVIRDGYGRELRLRSHVCWRLEKGPEWGCMRRRPSRQLTQNWDRQPPGGRVNRVTHSSAFTPHSGGGPLLSSGGLLSKISCFLDPLHQTTPRKFTLISWTVVVGAGSLGGAC